MAHAKTYFIPLFSMLIMIGCGESARDNSKSHYPKLSIHTEVLDKADAVQAKIVDGDTIKLEFDGIQKSIRLIGIDSFETHSSQKAKAQAYDYGITLEEVISRGKRAKTYIKEKLSKRVKFYMEYDEDFLDRYDRTLGYVWFSDDEMLNLDIICDGYALPLTIKPNDKYAESFLECYEAAKKDGLGVWAK